MLLCCARSALGNVIEKLADKAGLVDWTTVSKPQKVESHGEAYERVECVLKLP